MKILSEGVFIELPLREIVLTEIEINVIYKMK